MEWLSDDLVTWLRAQFDEVEQIARAAGPGPWRLVAESDRSGRTWTEIVDKTGGELYDTESGALEMAEGNAEHIVVNDPVYVLADVDAKRRILDEVVPLIDGLDDSLQQLAGVSADPSRWPAGVVPDPDLDPDHCTAAVALIRLLALPYADRPGYRQEWAP